MPSRASAYTEAELQAGDALASQVQAATEYLADDLLSGRHPGTAGSLLAQAYIIDELSPVAPGLFAATTTGDDAYRHVFSDGTNILGRITGRQLPNEYIVVGAHYDGRSGNAATDNAAGVAIVLAMAKAIGALPVQPRRSIVFALRDDEEFYLDGSAAFAAFASPLLPLIKTYVNFDIQGANLLPSLRKTSFAIGADTGGLPLTSKVDAAIATQDLEVNQLSLQFGQDRSDHVSFYTESIPIVFFSDGTGGCYHTSGDTVDIVDFGKLAKQSQIGFRLVVDLAETTSGPNYVAGTQVVYEDAETVSNTLNAAQADLSLFSPQDRTFLANLNSQFNQRVADGPGAFDITDQFATAIGAETFLDSVTDLDCDGFLLVPEPGIELQYTVVALTMLWLQRRGTTGSGQLWGQHPRTYS